MYGILLGAVRNKKIYRPGTLSQAVYKLIMRTKMHSQLSYKTIISPM